MLNNKDPEYISIQGRGIWILLYPGSEWNSITKNYMFIVKTSLIHYAANSKRFR